MHKFCKLVALSALVSLCSCNTVGPRAVVSGRANYNDAILESGNTQLLLNLVRLAQRDPMLAVEVDSISANYGQTYTAGIQNGSGSSQTNRVKGRSFAPLALTGSQATTLSHATVPQLTAGFTYTETPTVTYSPIQGADYDKQFLTPITNAAIARLASAFDLETLIMTTESNFLGQDNFPADFGARSSQSDDFPGSPYAAYAKDNFCAFKRRASDLDCLYKYGILTISKEIIPKDKGPGKDKDKDKETTTPPSTTPAPAPNTQHFAVNLSIDGVKYSPADGPKPVLALKLHSARAQTVVNTPGLPETEKQAITAAWQDLTGEGSPGACPSSSAVALKPDTATPLEEHSMPRSLFAILQFLSQGVELNDSSKSTLDGLFCVKSQTTEPGNAYIKVYHHDRWFYIKDDNDAVSRKSKEVFLLLSNLVQLQNGSAPDGEGAGGGGGGGGGGRGKAMVPLLTKSL